MKLSFIRFAVVLSLIAVVAATGCKRNPKAPTVLTSMKKGEVKDPKNTLEPLVPPPGPLTRIDAQPLPKEEPLTGIKSEQTPVGFGTAGLQEFEGMLKDENFFDPNTVYFDFDKSTVKASERVKVEEVALYLKGDKDKKLLIEGHCDERGTEEYNRALGERRALSLREYLTNLGISPDRIRTLSYGEDRPAVPGNSEAAWSKNRRGRFILLKPKL
jgi:peptidoglycan-associated lipoprotein